MRVDFITSEGAKALIKDVQTRLLNNLKTHVKEEGFVLPRGIIYNVGDNVEATEVISGLSINSGNKEELVVTIKSTVTDDWFLPAEILDLDILINILANIEKDYYDLLPLKIKNRLESIAKKLGEHDPYYLDKLTFCLDVYVHCRNYKDVWKHVSRMQCLRIVSVEKTLIQEEELGREKYMAIEALAESAEESI